MEPTSMFYDPPDLLDTTDRWTTKLATGTAAVAKRHPMLQLDNRSAYGGVFAQATFTNRGLNFVSFGVAAAFNAVTIANSARWIDGDHFTDNSKHYNANH